MGRPRSPLTVDQADQALAYLQRALDRKADLFSAGLKEAARSLATLRRRALTLRRPDFATEANVWLDQHLTSDGRRTMLAALRQREAVNRQDGPRHTVRLTAAVHADVAELAERLAMPPGSALGALVRLALADAALLSRLEGSSLGSLTKGGAPRG